MPWLVAEELPVLDLRFSRNSLGRPLIPDLRLASSQLEDAPHEIKVMAIEWAKEWLGISGSVRCDEAVLELDSAIAGLRRDHTSAEGLILLMASRALAHWRDQHRYDRTRKAFPWLRFIASPGKTACRCAMTLNDTLLAHDSAPKLPLPECDAHLCGCFYIQITEGRRAREIARNAF